MVCKSMLKWCLQGLLGQTQRAPLFKLLDILSLLLLEEHDEQSITDAEASLNESLALLERDFPMSLQVKCTT